MKKSMNVSFLSSILCVTLIGCALPYEHPANEPYARVRFVGDGQAWMSKDGKTYTLNNDSSINGAGFLQGSATGALMQQPANAPFTKLPVNQRINLGTNISVSTGYVHHWCRPGLSFIPQANRVYFLNAAMVGHGKCAIELLLEDPTKDVGVTWEYSVESTVIKK
jgi:hypothetical protein